MAERRQIFCLFWRGVDVASRVLSGNNLCGFLNTVGFGNLNRMRVIRCK